MQPSIDRPETVAHLREMAARYRQLALAAWDKDVLKILTDMSHDCDSEAQALEHRDTDDAFGT